MKLCLVPWENGDRCHSFWPTYSIDVIVKEKIKGRGKEFTKVPKVSKLNNKKTIYKTLWTSVINCSLSHLSLKWKNVYRLTWGKIYTCCCFVGTPVLQTSSMFLFLFCFLSTTFFFAIFISNLKKILVLELKIRSLKNLTLVYMNFERCLLLLIC